MQIDGPRGHLNIKKQARNWTAAFKALDERIPKSERTVVLLDEISWMGSRNPDFAGFLKTAWDKRLKKHDNLVFVLCGSVSSWIAENILDSTGFVGRDSLDLDIGELSLSESDDRMMTEDRISHWTKRRIKGRI